MLFTATQQRVLDDAESERAARECSAPTVAVVSAVLHPVLGVLEVGPQAGWRVDGEVVGAAEVGTNDDVGLDAVVVAEPVAERSVAEDCRRPVGFVVSCQFGSD